MDELERLKRIIQEKEMRIKYYEEKLATDIPKFKINDFDREVILKQVNDEKNFNEDILSVVPRISNLNYNMKKFLFEVIALVITNETTKLKKMLNSKQSRKFLSMIKGCCQNENNTATTVRSLRDIILSRSVTKGL